MEAASKKRQPDGVTYERDMVDLVRFRAALAKLNACQKREVIQQLLGKPGTL